MQKNTIHKNDKITNWMVGDHTKDCNYRVWADLLFAKCKYKNNRPKVYQGQV